MNHHVSSLNKSLNKRAKRQLYVSLPELEKVPLEEVYVNPNQPKVKIYLRYARRSDMSGCLQIYEHFRKETVVAPEMGVVTPSEMLATYDDVASNKLPFLVAVEGQLGSHGREPRSVGKVVGYAFAEDFAGSYTAYCYTAEIQIFIHPEFLHKGVGKCLMDMLLLLLDPAHVQRGGYRFLSEGSEWCAGGKRVISKVICNIPFAKDDAEIGWKKDWLVNWEFEEVGRLVKVGVKHMKWVSVLQMLRTTGSRIYNVSG
ncbi:MAG: hypothetical protein M1832_001073 [Thelocarpon impressellum]|nr:MAG: hypothetical protein M1832_001073 [Thelocarpon impressellum]